VEGGRVEEGEMKRRMLLARRQPLSVLTLPWRRRQTL